MDLSRRAEAEAMRYSPMSKSSPHFVKVFRPDPCSQHLCWCLMQLHAKRRWLSVLGLAVEMWPPSIGSCLARRQLSLIGPACKTLILFNVNVDEKEVKDLKALVLTPVDGTLTEKRRKTRSINHLASQKSLLTGICMGAMV
ncbi:hypothetical protein B296_00058469 [Ensete ventricosum]|uniref:Uncharacterized protein n=1 Tax=Ensete ventricosum TaxID=4639 RepID=A0A426WZL3_ENSVE|nr:hypothetical protein B296_00058469 [Ensete ventricosum]